MDTDDTLPIEGRLGGHTARFSRKCDLSCLTEGKTSVLSALGFLNSGLHLMQTFFIFLTEQSSQLIRI